MRTAVFGGEGVEEEEGDGGWEVSNQKFVKR